MPLVRLVAVFFFLCFATAARADAVDDALAKFLDNKFASTEQGVSALAATGAANAPAILDALGDNRLLIDPVAHIIVYQTTGGDLINAKTGEKLSGVDADSFKKVRVNNALRSAIEAAVGALTLASPDPQKRASAAEAVFKSRDANALTVLDAQLSRENDPHVADAMRQARAAIVVLDPKTPSADRVAAVATLKARGDQDAQSLIDEVAAKSDDPAVKAAALDAEAAIKAHLAWLNVLQNLIYGVSRRLGAAARRDRPRHHLRRHGRHQHGARRDGDARRLLDLRRPERAAAELPAMVARRRAAGRLPRLGDRRRRDRAPGHPLPLWPAAGDPARHLGRVADPAAGGAQPVRRQQPPGRRAQLHVGLVRLGRPADHDRPAVDRRAGHSRLRRAADSRCARHRSACACAR